MYNFPYTNFHDINMDWILRKIYELESKDTTDNENSIYNVKKYGAAGDGVTDDYDAVMACIGSIDNPGYIYFPPGQYFLSAKIVAENISFIGAGKNLSILIFDGTDGLDLTQTEYLETTNNNCVTVANLSLWQKQKYGKALKISGSIPGNRTTQAPAIYNVQIESADGDKFTSGWLNGIEFNNCNGGYIDHCCITGSIDPILQEPYYDGINGIVLASDMIPHSTDYKITNSFINYFQQAVYSTVFEGLHFVNNTMLGCENGIKAVGANLYPLIIATENHFNTADKALDIQNIKEIIIANNSIYQQLTDNTLIGYGCYFNGVTEIQISNNQFMNLSVKDHTAVFIHDCNRAVISGNISVNKGAGSETHAIVLEDVYHGIIVNNITSGDITDDQSNLIDNNVVA